MWHKYKDNDNYKYEDKGKDEDAKTIPGTLTVCYIFGILMTRPVQPSTAQNSLAMCSNVFKLVQNLFKRVQMCSNLFKTCWNVFECVQTCSKLVQMCSIVFKLVKNLFKCYQMCPWVDQGSKGSRAMPAGSQGVKGYAFRFTGGQVVGLQLLNTVEHYWPFPLDGF